MTRCNNKDEQKDGKDNKKVIGIIFLVIGLVFLGRNFDFIPHNIAYVLFSWPTILIVIGSIILVGKKKSIGGLFMIATGGVFLWDRLYPLSPLDWKFAWPAIFIFVGVALVVSYINKPENKQVSNQKPKQKKKKGKYDDIEFDIDKIEPIED